MVACELEGRGHLSLLGAVPHERTVAAGAERQRESIEKDGFSGARLAGQRREPGREIDIEPVDQDDVANRQADQHGRTS